MLAAAERAGDQLVTAMHTTMLAGVCYVRGDWDRGRELVGRAQVCFAASSSPMAVRWVGVLAPALIWHGAWDQARAYLEGSLQAARSVQLVSIALIVASYGLLAAVMVVVTTAGEIAAVVVAVVEARV